MGYRLSDAAAADLVSIYLDGIDRFGARQADAYHDQLSVVFELIATQPHMARERAEITPPVRIHPHGAHLIVYLIEGGGGILVLRVRHARENWFDGGST